MLGFGAPPTRAPEPTGFLQLEDGAYLLNEEGGRISLNVAPAPPVHGLAWAGYFNDYNTVRIWDLAYAAGKFVAVGGTGVGDNTPIAFSSVDGFDWQQIVFPFSSWAPNAFFTAVVYANGNWVLIATSSIISAVPSIGYTSPDLVNWTSGDIGLNAVTHLTFNGTKFLAASRNDLLFQSDTLSGWAACTMSASARQLTSNEVSTYWYRKNLRSLNGFFFVVNYYAFGVSNTGVHMSADGITWVRKPVVLSGIERTVASLSYINGRYYGTATGSVPFYSSDFSTWTFATPGGITAGGAGVGYAEGTYLALGGSTTSVLMTSQDGVTFKNSRAAVMPVVASEKIISAGSTFVVLNCAPGSGNPQIYTSL